MPGDDKTTTLGLHCKRSTQMREISFCLFRNAAIFQFLASVQVVQVTGRFTEFDKSAFFLLHYMVNAMTQNLESRNHKMQVLWAVQAEGPNGSERV